MRNPINIRFTAPLLAAALAFIPGVRALAQADAPAPSTSSAPLRPADQASAASTYAAMLKRVQQGDMTVNFRTFRLAAALMSPHDDPVATASMKEQGERATFKRLMDAGSTQEALDAANRALDRNYASLAGHLNAVLACNKLNKPAEAAVHRKILNALLDSIQRSGDGKSPETAWFVVTISEEYIFLATRLSLQRTQQGLVRKDGHVYDELEVLDPKTGQKQKVWFNTDVDMNLYRPAAPRTPEAKAKFERALQLYLKEQSLTALPLIQDLSAGDPEDATLQMVLADCLEFKAGTNVSAAESLALLKQARDAAVRARQLGDNSQRLNELLARLDTPEPRPRKFSEIVEADQAMKDGEQALGTGDYDAALKAYTAALSFDPKLYTAAMYAGEMYFRKKDPASAADWFTKAVGLNPGNPVVYRHWGDELMLAGRPAEARDKYIEAVITLPVPQSWSALANWAKRTNHQLSPPRIDRPPVPDQAQPTGSDSMTTSDDGRSAWKSYSAVRAAWRQSVFAEKYPAEKDYRHTLEEEAAALTSVALALNSQKPLHLDPQLAALSELKDAGLVEAWILLSGADAWIAQDYAGYREKHRLQLRTYIEKYVIRPAFSVNSR